jgi:hypothetical protein
MSPPAFQRAEWLVKHVRLAHSFRRLRLHSATGPAQRHPYQLQFEHLPQFPLTKFIDCTTFAPASRSARKSRAIPRGAGAPEGPLLFLARQDPRYFACSFAHESRKETIRLNTGLPGFESLGSARK